MREILKWSPRRMGECGPRDTVYDCLAVQWAHLQLMTILQLSFGLVKYIIITPFSKSLTRVEQGVKFYSFEHHFLGIDDTSSFREVSI